MCPFCNFNPAVNKLIFESGEFRFFYNIKPIIKGHTMLVPKAHIREESDIKKEQWIEYHEINKKAIDYMKAKYKNPMIFINAPQDQSVHHFHKHFLPGCFGEHGVDNALRNFLNSKGIKAFSR